MRLFVKYTALILLLCGCSGQSQAAAFPLSGELTGGGTVMLAPDAAEVIIGQSGSWRLVVSGAGGQPADPLSIAFDAAMPGHGHGLPQPAVVRETSESGVYQVRDVLFNMGGRWVISVRVGMADGLQQLDFDLDLATPDRLSGSGGQFSAGEVGMMQALTLAVLPKRQDKSNRLSGNAEAIRLGERLFFDPGLSMGGAVACASCHQPERFFTDGRTLAFGSRELQRNAPGLLGVGQGNWFYWDGRRDSLWSQALTPLETPGEMNNTRTDVVRYVTGHEGYGQRFRKLSATDTVFADSDRFPEGAGPFAAAGGRQRWFEMAATDQELINRAFADVGKILAAFEETLQVPASRFDRFVATLGETGTSADTLLSAAEQNGLRLFLDSSRTHCLRCHNGPLLTNQGFHAIGSQAHFLDLGRQLGLDAARVDPFNCTGAYSDSSADCGVSQMAGVDAGGFRGAFKVPTLRNLSHTAPYFHDGRFADLEAVMAFYLNPPGPEEGNHEAPKLDLSGDEVVDLIAFLRTLSASDSGYSSIAR